MKHNLDYYLEEIQVLSPGQWENDLTDTDNGNNIANWFAISNVEGIIAYFGNEVDVNRFRLDYINRLLNP